MADYSQVISDWWQVQKEFGIRTDVNLTDVSGKLENKFLIPKTDLLLKNGITS